MSSVKLNFHVILAFTVSIFSTVSSESFTGFKSCNSKEHNNNTFILKLPPKVPETYESLLCQRQNQEQESSEEATDYVYYRSGYFSERLDLPIDGNDICPDFQLVPEESNFEHSNSCGVTPLLFQFSIYAPFSNAREDVAPWEKIKSFTYGYYSLEFLITGTENCTFVIAQYRIGPWASGCHEKVSQYCYTRAGPDTCEQEFYPQSIYYKQRNSVVAWKNIVETEDTAEDQDLATSYHPRRSNIGVRRFVGTFLILSVLLFYVKYGMLKRSLQFEENAASEAAERAEFDTVMSARRLIALNRFMDNGYMDDRNRSLESPYCSTSLLDSTDPAASGCTSAGGGWGCAGSAAAPPPRYPGHSVYVSVEDDTPPTYEQAVALQKNI